MYWGIKVVQLVLAASVPVAAGVAAPVGLTGSLGALIVVLEGIQQLFQFHSNWIRYRVTAAGDQPLQGPDRRVLRWRTYGPPSPAH